MSYNKNKGCGCLAVAGALIGIVGGGYLLSKAFLGQELTPHKGAEIIPDEAVMTSYISTNAQDWSKLDKFGTPEAKQIINENWQEFTQDLTKDNQNIDYKKDIQPWLGGMMLTVLPSSESYGDYNLVGIVGIKNKFKAWDFMRKIKKTPNSKTVESKYKNMTIYQISDDEGNVFFATSFKNYLVFSDNQENVEQVIDTFKGETSLADKTKSSKLFSQKLNLKNPVFQIYLADYDQLINEAIANSIYGQNIPPKTLKEINSIVMGISIEDKGFHFQTVANLATPIDKKLLKTASNKLIEKMPSNTIFMVNSQGISEVWQEIEKEAKAIPELNQIFSQWKYSLKNAMGLDLEKDVFGWLDGELAFGLFTEDNQSFANSGLGGLVLIETSDRPTAENTIDTLENLSNQIPSLEIIREKSKGIPITKWQTFQSPLFSYGWLNKRDFMLTLGSDFSTTQDIKSQQSLVNNDNFKLATKSLPNKNFGYVYFDLEQIWNFYNNTISNQMPNSIPKEAEAIANSLEAIAMTSSMINPHTTQLDLMLTLKTN